MALSNHDIGIWLYDSSTEQEVLLVSNDASASATIGEMAATLALLHQQAPVRIVGQMRGFEGSVSGLIVDGALGRTAANDRAVLVYFAHNSATPRKLKMGAMDMEVLIGNVTCSPTGEAIEMYDVSFDYWQVASFEES